MNILLNIYTVIALIAVIAMAFFIYKLKVLLPQLSIDKILKANSNNYLETTINILLYLFCPLLHILFIGVVMYFLYLDNNESVKLIDEILDNAIKRNEQEEYEKNNNQ
jgi:predicted PurR-regulated permease PerM